jgi:hypothetical protein
MKNTVLVIVCRVAEESKVLQFLNDVSMIIFFLNLLAPLFFPPVRLGHLISSMPATCPYHFSALFSDRWVARNDSESSAGNSIATGRVRYATEDGSEKPD